MLSKEKKKREPNTKEYALNDFIYIKLKNRQNSFMVIEAGIAVTFVGGVGGFQECTYICQNLNCALKICVLYCLLFA